MTHTLNQISHPRSVLFILSAGSRTNASEPKCKRSFDVVHVNQNGTMGGIMPRYPLSKEDMKLLPGKER